MKKVIFVLFLVLLFSSLEAKPPFMRFKNIGEKDGLIFKEAFCVVEDKHQILWVGTGQGLTRFDGVRFLPFNPNDSLATFLEKSFIFDLKTDAEGNIWIATLGNGLFCYEFDTDKLRVYTHDENDSLSIPSDHITKIAWDKDGNQWVTTINGLYLMKKNGERKVFQHKEGDEKGLAGNYLYGVIVDRRGHIWVSSPSGVNRLIPIGNDNFHIKTYTEHDGFSQLPNNSVWTMAEGLDGKIWMALVVGDFGLFDPDTEKYTSYSDPLEDKNGFPFCLLPDDKGNLWIADNTRGLMRLNISDKTIELIKRDENEPTSIGGGYTKQIYKSPSGKWIVAHTKGISFFQPYNQFFKWEASPSRMPGGKDWVYSSSMYPKEDGRLWVAGGAGLQIWDPKDDSWEFVLRPDTDLGMTNYKGFQEIFADSKGRVWLETRLGGPSYWDTKRKKGRKIPVPAMGLIHGYWEDSKGNIWMATDGYGIGCWDANTDSIHSYHWPESKNKVVRERFLNFVQTPDGTIWLGSYGDGLHQFDPKTRTYLKKVKREKGNPNSLASNIIRDICNDGKGGLWMATDEGLSYYNPKTNSVKNYDTQDGLPANSLRTVIFDKEGFLWIGTLKGLVRFDLEKETFRTFNEADGIAGVDFAVGEATMLGDQMVFLGGNGLTIFNPTVIPQSLPAPQVVLTSFNILNKRANLPQAPETLDYIELTHQDYSFTFEFVAPGASQPEDLQYATMLVGLDEDWIQMGKNQSATYTVLPPGEYTFLAKIWDPQNSDATAPLRVKLYIKPAFWQTILFKVFLILLATGMLLFMIWLGKRQLEIRHEKELAEQSAAYKSQFLANMSHEIRTPMHAVLSAAELLAQSPLDEKQERYLKHIRRAGSNLLNLINDILDFSKIEAGKLDFKAEPFSLKEVFGYVHKSLETPATDRGNELAFFMPAHLPDRLVGDPGRLGQILLNLLSNAIKFTQGGKIELVAGIQEEEMERLVLSFQIKDNGVGISEDKLEQIFESFVQGENQQNLSLAGVGLGLAITRQLVEQQGGGISVESKKDQGTIFSFYLPFQKAIVTNSEPVQVLRQTPSELQLQRILLVEDIALNRELALDMICKAFPAVEVMTAESGVEALKILEKNPLPDLILMDVRMPDMDGFTCTSHIRDRYGAIVPIVALTASATEAEMKRCFKLGMDAFLAKPFTPDQLIQCIHDVLAQDPLDDHLSINREQLSHFLGHDETRITRYLSASRDEIFRHYRSLRLGISQDNWDSAQIAAHSLKTTFRYLGVESLAERFSALEKALQKQDEEAALNGLGLLTRDMRGFWGKKMGSTVSGGI